MMRKAFLMCGLILGCVSPALAAPPPGFEPMYYGPPPSIPPPSADRAYRRLVAELTELREMALELQASDGGTLTAEHSDYIQTRIDAAFAEYRRQRD
jgi:hypothetical protein